MITGIKPRVGLVRNSHIDRALRMEAGARFESSWSSKPGSASPRLSRLVSLPPALVIPSTFAGGVLCALLPFRFLAPCVRLRRRRRRRHRQRDRVVLRQDYRVNNAPNSPRDLSCIIAKLFRSRFQSASFQLFGSSGSCSSDRGAREVLELAFASPRRQNVLSSKRNSSSSCNSDEGERERESLLFFSEHDKFVHLLSCTRLNRLRSCVRCCGDDGCV